MTRLILGTAQLGLTTGTPYGINNTTGHLTDKQAFAVLDAAKANGFYGIDTAPAYGEAERRIKAWNGGLPVFTKWHVVPNKPHLSSFPGAKVLVHNGDDMGKIVPKGAVDGFSCYDIRNAPRWAEYVQFPFNIIDAHNWRFRQTDKRKAIIRSVFLQGLFHTEYLCEVALRYVITAMHPWAMCIGAETPRQVEQIALWHSKGEIDLWGIRKKVTDPRNWGQKYDFT